jgi:hypothetical protein
VVLFPVTYNLVGHVVWIGERNHAYTSFFYILHTYQGTLYIDGWTILAPWTSMILYIQVYVRSSGIKHDA